LGSGSTKVQYQTIIYIFAKILTLSKANDNKLPNSFFVNVKKNSKLNKYLPKYTVDIKYKTVSSKKLNIDYDAESSEEYLSSSKNCQANDEKIIELSHQITKKYNSIYDKAKAIFNWVRDKVRYNFYYNTKYGAKNTMTKKEGNCVDKSHLIVALSRASGIASRYVHGKCDFISGRNYGHVWAQVKVGNTWYAADSTSSKNSFGVIRNWNTDSYTLKGIYSSLSF
jgi:transglutaminase-like putative cysteine protease